MSRLQKLAPPPYDTIQQLVEGEAPGSDDPFAEPEQPEPAPGGPVITVKTRQLTGEELVAAGLTTTKRFYRMWTDQDLPFTEAATIRHSEAGDLQIQSVVPYRERGITVIEASRVATA